MWKYCMSVPYRERTNMTTYYVGIDIAKNKHDVNIFSATEKKSVAKFVIKNDIFHYNLLIEKCKIIDKDLTKFIFCCEATGIYHISLCNYLYDKNQKVNIVNPVLIKNFKKVDNIRNTKNDSIDALSIATYAQFKQAKPNYESRTSNEQLRSLTRFRTTEVKLISETKVKIRTLLDKNIPELSMLFPNVGSTTCIYLLSSSNNLFNIASRDKQQLCEQISKHSHGKHKMTFTEKVIKAIKNSKHNSHNTSDMLELKLLTSELKFHVSQLKIIDESIKILMESLETPIETIPGISKITGSQIIAEIGEINNFASPKQLVAYAGLDPRIQQSGNYELQNGRMNKKGSKYLRQALFQAAQCLYRHDDYFAQRYKKLRDKGKHHYVCVNAIARKLLHIIWAMEKRKVPYDPAFLLN